MRLRTYVEGSSPTVAATSRSLSRMVSLKTMVISAVFSPWNSGRRPDMLLLSVNVYGIIDICRELRSDIS